MFRPDAGDLILRGDTSYGMGVSSAPEWRNWQTRQVEGLVPITGSAGSIPVSGTRKALRNQGFLLLPNFHRGPFAIAWERKTMAGRTSHPWFYAAARGRRRHYRGLSAERSWLASSVVKPDRRCSDDCRRSIGSKWCRAYCSWSMTGIDSQNNSPASHPQ